MRGQTVALLLAGAVAGAGGREVVGALKPGAVQAAPLPPYVHAVDLRRDGPSSPLRVTAYATRVLDGGVNDLGQAKSCTLAAESSKRLIEDLNTLAKECIW